MKRSGEWITERYQILEGIKEGGMGAVYRASDQKENRIVAVKLMHDDVAGSFKQKKFVDEAAVLARLNHPQVPRVWDHFAFEQSYCIVMEFVEGDSLETVLAEHVALTGFPMSARLVLDHALQICGILRYLHEQPQAPLIHRDVKPGNLLVRRGSNDVVLVDFGLARGYSGTTMTTITQAGTLGYAPPEQLRGETDPRSDIYGLGATMFNLLTGKRPTALKVCLLRAELPDVRTELADLVEKATQQNMEHRFGTARAMEKALSYARKMEMSAPPSPPRPPTSVPVVASAKAVHAPPLPETMPMPPSETHEPADPRLTYFLLAAALVFGLSSCWLLYHALRGS